MDSENRKGERKREKEKERVKGRNEGKYNFGYNSQTNLKLRRRVSVKYNSEQHVAVTRDYLLTTRVMERK